MVSLIGEAGVGKSRLVAELRSGVQAFRRSGVQVPTKSDPSDPSDPERLNARTPERLTPLWLEGRCLELGMAAGYSLVIDFFRDYFAWRPEEDERARGERITAALKALVEQGSLPAAQCDEMGPLLGNLLSVRFGTDWDERLKTAGPEQIRHQTFTAVRDFFCALSRQRPLVLVCEDLHWADALSLDLISLLMEALPQSPVLLLCIYRPERDRKCAHLATIAERKCPERSIEIRLRELSPEQSGHLVASLLTGGNLPSSLKDVVLQKSRGNPFFIEEVIRSLIDSGMIYRDGATWRAREPGTREAGGETIAVSEGVQSLILSRVDRLRPDLKRVLQSATVIGRLFPRRLLERTISEGVDLERALWELEDQGLVYQERAVPEEEYSFKHVLTQETVYRNILRRHRAGLHQKVAEVMEALYRERLDEYYEQLAYHYDLSAHDEKAVEYLLKAGEKARRAYLNEEAIGYFQRARDRLGASPLGEARKDWRLGALKGLGLIYHAVGKERDAEVCRRQAIAIGKEIGLAPRELVRLLYWLAYALNWQGRMDEVITVGEEGLALLGDDTESVEAAMMNAHLAVGYLKKGDGSRWREFNLRNAQFLQSLPYSEELDWGYANVACVHAQATSQTHLEEARDWLRALERAARQHHDLTAVAQMHWMMGEAILVPTGDLRRAVSEYRQAHGIFEKVGNLKLGATCLRSMGSVFLSLGDLKAAEQHLSRAFEIQGRVGARMYMMESLGPVGIVSLCQGRTRKAAEAFQRLAHLEQEMHGPGSGAGPRIALGRAYLADGQRENALREFRTAMRLEREAPSLIEWALDGIEEACENQGEFRSLCHRLREEIPELGNAPFTSRLLKAARPRNFSQLLVDDAFTRPGLPGWVWVDPFGDCAHAVGCGLEMRAANGRALWHVNLSAPRFLRPAAGDFAVQTICLPATSAKPAIGGILLWKDQANYLLIEQGARRRHDVRFSGCVGNEDEVVGRARLPAERSFLRLERLGSRVLAL